MSTKPWRFSIYYTVDAVVDSKEYNPYGKLEIYLSSDGFDLIEMDTADLKKVVVKDLIIEVPTSLPKRLLKSSVSAVIINGRAYAYPTLVCGNFIISLTPEFPNCNLRDARSDYDSFFDTMEKCKASVFPNSSHAWERLFGGKMNDEAGWYLPFLYLDGYIDIHGSQSIDDAIDELITQQYVGPILCERLSWLIGNCNDFQGEGQNKCYDNFSGSYVQSSSNVYPDVENDYMFFGFSEKVAQIERDSSRMSLSALSGPLGSQNLLLQFTDALVINKARWNAASEDKK